MTANSDGSLATQQELEAAKECLLSPEEKKLIEEGEKGSGGLETTDGVHLEVGTAVAANEGMGPEAFELESYVGEVPEEEDSKMPAVEGAKQFNKGTGRDGSKKKSAEASLLETGDVETARVTRDNKEAREENERMVSAVAKKRSR